MKKIFFLFCYLVFLVNLTSCYTNIIDTGMDGFVEQSTDFIAPNAEDAVDLGLSVRWAPYNVGASEPTDFGNYYAVGEIEPKIEYSEDTYVGYYGGDMYGTEYDVAHVKWGEGWRIPTYDEMIELHEKCKWEDTILDGVRGMKVTGPNGKSIFLPAAGRCVGTRFEDVGITGHYWQGCANSGWFMDDYLYYDLNLIYHGLTIRPVLSDIVNSNQLYYTFFDNTDGESEWERAMVMSNGYYSLIKKDTLNNTVVYLDKVGTNSDDTKVVGEFDENDNIVYLHIDSDTYYFYNHHDGYADAMTFKNGEMEIIENIKLSIEEEPQTKAGVSQNHYFSTLGIMSNAGGVIKGGATGTLEGISLVLNFGNYTPNQELVLDLVTGAAVIGVATVTGIISSPVIIGASIVGTGAFAFAKWWEATTNEEKKERYYKSAGNCQAITLDPVMISNNSYKIGMEVINSGSISSEYKNNNYYGIILQKFIPPHASSFNVYSTDVETVMYQRGPSDGKYEFTLSDLEGGYKYRYRSFVIPYPETINFNSPEEGLSIKNNSGSAFSSAVYYGDIKSFEVDNACIVDCTQAKEPYCKNDKIVFTINVTAKMENPPTSDYAFTDWGIVIYNNDKRIDASMTSIGKGIWNDTVEVSFEADKSSLDVDFNNYTAKTLDKWFVTTYTTYSADGYSGTSDGVERYPVDLVYNQKPSLSFTSAKFNGTETLSFDEETGYTEYETSFDIEYKANGSFWFNTLNFGIPSDVDDYVGIIEIEKSDGINSGSYCWVYYNDGSDTSLFFLYLIGNLHDGGTFVSDNMLVFNGNPIQGVDIVSGTTRSVGPQMKSTYRESLQKRTFNRVN